MIVSSGVRELTITRIDGDGDCKLLSAAIPACRALASLAIGTRSVRAKPISETGTRLVLEGIIAASPTLRRFQWCVLSVGYDHSAVSGHRPREPAIHRHACAETATAAADPLRIAIAGAMPWIDSTR